MLTALRKRERRGSSIGLLELLKGECLAAFGSGSCFGRIACRDPASARRRRLPLAPRCGRAGKALAVVAELLRTTLMLETARLPDGFVTH
jgi:hypothetical protein